MSDSLQLTMPLPPQPSYSFTEIELPIRLKLETEFAIWPYFSSYMPSNRDAFVSPGHFDLSKYLSPPPALWRDDSSRRSWQLVNDDKPISQLTNHSEQSRWEVDLSNDLVLVVGGYRMGQP